MQNELLDSLVGIRSRRHHWVGGAMAPSEEVWDKQAGALCDDDGLRITDVKPVWALPSSFTLGLVYDPPALIDADCTKQAGPKELSWALRNQNYQPTCIAEAVVACIELMNIHAPTCASDDPLVVSRFSVRFLYQQMREMGDPNPAMQRPVKEWKRGYTRLANAKDALAERGICPETMWPDEGDLHQPPTKQVAEHAKTHCIQTMKHEWYQHEQSRPRGVAKLIVEELCAGRPVAIALPAYADWQDQSGPNNWTRASVLLTGHVTDPSPRDKPVKRSGHAVCIVGFLPNSKILPLANQDKLGGRFVFRNSLGEDFASLPPPSTLARGYGTISASHVETHCWELLSLKRPDWMT
jgi:hypothetical protein